MRRLAVAWAVVVTGFFVGAVAWMVMAVMALLPH
jgi:hypothetical protein